MRNVLFLLFACLLLASCGHHTAVRSVYYWQTTLKLGTKERAFLKQHGVSKVYCRYFDVVPGDDGTPQPNATLSFEGSFPKNVEVIPVVYIVNDCMAEPHEGLAEKIFNRILQMNETNNVAQPKELQMNETNNVAQPKELQIDCDWTGSTRLTFFAFMKELRAMCHSHNMTLSATIRLHQLSQPVPPVDRGVLMMYNTGDVTKLSVKKPILDMKDVAPYLHALSGYKLPLSTAYPLFTWHVLFRGGRYVGIMHGDDDLPVLPGDSIVVRQPELADIFKAQKAVDKAQGEDNNEIILYDLSDKNINRFSYGDFQKIYRYR